MRFRKLRIVWSVVWGTVCLVLTAACFALLYRGSNVELMRRGGPGPTVIQIDEGEITLSWEPGTPYRPRWAGQTLLIVTTIAVVVVGSIVWAARN